MVQGGDTWNDNRRVRKWANSNLLFVEINTWYRLSSIGKFGFATNAYARRMQIYFSVSKNRISLCCKRPSFLVSHSQTVKTFHPSFLNFL